MKQNKILKIIILSLFVFISFFTINNDVSADRGTCYTYYRDKAGGDDKRDASFFKRVYYNCQRDKVIDNDTKTKSVQTGTYEFSNGDQVSIINIRNELARTKSSLANFSSFNSWYDAEVRSQGTNPLYAFVYHSEVACYNSFKVTLTKRGTCTQTTYTPNSWQSCRTSGTQIRTWTRNVTKKASGTCHNSTAGTNYRNCTYTYPAYTKYYKYSYTNNWQNCVINSNWIVGNTITCKQHNNYITNYKRFTKVHTVYGGRNTYTCNNGIGSNYRCNSSTVAPSDATPPTGTNLNNLVTIKGTFSAGRCFPDDGTIYADNIDTCYIKVDLTLTTNKTIQGGKSITGLSNTPITSITSITYIDPDRIVKSTSGNNNALNFSNIGNVKLAGFNKNYNFYIKNISSIAPFKIDNGKVGFKIGNSNFELKDISYNFAKPFSLSLNINDSETNNSPILFKEQEYILDLRNDSNSLDIDGKLYANKATIEIDDTHKWEKSDFGDTDNDFVSITGSALVRNSFSGTLSAIDDSGILTTPSIKADNVPISYTLGRANIKYSLGNNIDGCKLETLGLKVDGIIQGDGRSNQTTAEGVNFSNMTKVEYRTLIRKNAYNLTKFATSGTFIDGVKYFEGDTTLSGIQDYETLIVKNGNVIIEGDITRSNGEPFGIIVLSDGYNVSDDPSNTKGNIYVKNTVTKINAVIYADGAFMSAKANGVGYSDDKLTNNLTLFGSLFSRNTIGGAVEGLSDSLLPGGKTTLDYNLAKKYDLNHIRKVPKECNGSNSNTYSFTIKYNPSIQTNPPKGFRE